MNTVLAMIIMIYNNSLKTDVATSFSRYLISNLYRIEKMSIREISSDSFTSTGSIVNYSKMMGFDSFSEFKHQLYDNIKIRRMQMSFRYSKLSCPELLERIASFAPEDFDLKELDSNVDKLIDLISKNDSLTIIGALFPVALTLSFQEDMAIMGKPVFVKQLAYNSGDQDFEPDSLLVLITITGRFVQISKNFYHQIIESTNDIAIFSQDSLTVARDILPVMLPFIGDTEYNDVILLLILDLVKLKYHTKYCS